MFDLSLNPVALARLDLSALVLGFLTSMFALAVGVEFRVRRLQGEATVKGLGHSLAVSGLMTLSMYFSSAYMITVLEDFHPAQYSLSLLALVFGACWLFLFMWEFMLRRARQFKVMGVLVFGCVGVSGQFAIHAGFLFIPLGVELRGLGWGAVLSMVLPFGLCMMVLGQMALSAKSGIVKSIKTRIVYIVGVSALNMMVALSLMVLTSGHQTHGVVSPFAMWSISMSAFERALNVFSLLMTLGLMVYAYTVLQRSMQVLRASNQNLQTQRSNAIALVEESNKQLRREQDRSRQLERAIETVQKDHQVSVEGLVAALSSLEDGMFEWDLEQDRLEFSPLWLRFLGFDQDVSASIPAQRWRQGILAEDQIHLNKSMQVCLTAPEAGHITQVRYRTPFGNLMKLEIRIVAVKNAYGLPSKLVGILHDRTDEMDLEMSIRAELNEEALLSSRKSQFVDYLAHEIRTPMTVISSAKALIESCLRRDRIDKYTVLGYVDQIGLALKSLRALVDETLMFMGSGFSHSSLEVRSLDVTRLLDEFVELELRLHGVESVFEVRFDERIDSTAFYSDEYAFSQAVRQLVAFARNKTSGVDRIELARSDNDGLCVMMRLNKQLHWLESVGQKDTVAKAQGIVPFKDEHLPFSLLLTKRVIRFIGGRLMIVSRGEENWLTVDLPSLKEDACHV